MSGYSQVSINKLSKLRKRRRGVGTLKVRRFTSISVKNRQPPNLREMEKHYYLIQKVDLVVTLQFAVDKSEWLTFFEAFYNSHCQAIPTCILIYEDMFQVSARKSDLLDLLWCSSISP